MNGDRSEPGRPDPGRVKCLDDLARELDLLRRWAARGSRKTRVSLSDLAARVDLPRSTVHAHVSGTTLPPPDVLDAIVIALGADGPELRDWAEAWHRACDHRGDQRRAAKNGADSRQSRPPIPRQLPADVADFTGRVAELAALDAVLIGGRPGAAPPIALVCGPAGVGKTALAVHWARRVADQFLDGQLYVNLRGYGQLAPRDPAQVLDQFLRDLGVRPAQVPADPDDRAALLRSSVANRRIVFVLDNARDAEQVRPLLPGPHCAALVISRGQLRGLCVRDGARPVPVDRMPADEAVQLLMAVTAIDHETATRIAGYCDGLPLALRIVGERAGRRSADLAELVDELAEDSCRLDALNTGDGDPDTDLRTVLSWSYRALPQNAARLFRRLSLHPGADFEAVAASRLAGTPIPATRRDLDTLVSLNLLEDTGTRYQLHDLVRIYVAELARGQDSGRDQEAAVSRLFSWLLHATDTAVRVLRPHWNGLRLPDSGEPAPHFADRPAAIAWLDAEWLNLLVVAQRVAESGPRNVSWLLAERLSIYFTLRQNTAELIPTLRTALAAARSDADAEGEAVSRIGLGSALMAQGKAPDAAAHFTAAVELSRSAGLPVAEARALSNLGLAHSELGRLDAAADAFSTALAINREIGRRVAEGDCLGNLAFVYWMTGRLDDSAATLRQAHLLHQEVGDDASCARDLTNLAEIECVRGELSAAAGYVRSSLETYRRVGSRVGEGAALDTLAQVHYRSGRHDEALRCSLAAVAASRETGHTLYQAKALTTLGRIRCGLDNPAQAVQDAGQALALARDSGGRYLECEALIVAAEANLLLHDLAAAQQHAEEALAISRDAGYRVLEDLARAVRNPQPRAPGGEPARRAR